ncbi:MAG TPA: ABATE domain-containing protein [Acidimicrobiales bacterium]
MSGSTTPLPSGRVVTHPISGQVFRFDAGAAAVDFAFSGAEGDLAAFETLHTPDDLRRWLAEDPLLLDVGPLTDRDLARALRVRRAITAVTYACARGEALPPGAVAELNATAARPPLVPTLSDGGERRWAEPITLDQVLSTFARELIELVGGPMRERFRVCGGDNCLLAFVDASRPGKRRWCSMERCGNRHKVRAHRTRHRAP